MDLLGSIMSKMDKPPVIKKSAEEQERVKKHNENLKKMQDHEKQKLKEFREKIKVKIDKFVADESAKELKFDTMEKFLRMIVHDVAETADLQGVSYGIEGEDRHVVVYKKEYLPSAEEIACLKKGEVYDPEKIEQERKLKEEEEASYNQKRKTKEKPNLNYHDKYKHIIGDIDQTGKKAAQITTPNQSFGLVSSSNKRDIRSIEQTLEDIKKKKLKSLEPVE